MAQKSANYVHFLANDSQMLLKSIIYGRVR